MGERSDKKLPLDGSSSDSFFNLTLQNYILMRMLQSIYLCSFGKFYGLLKDDSRLAKSDAVNDCCRMVCGSSIL